MKYSTKIKLYMISNADKRTKIITKKKLFKSVGNNFFFQPRIIPDEPKLISFGNNVVVASGVTFVTHDVIDKVLNKMQNNFNYNYYCSPILIGDNVFIGCNVTILPNVKIGNNVIIAAGSIVNKDVPDNSVVGGNPAKVIGNFNEYVESRKKINDEILYPSNDNAINKIWERFYNEKGIK